jgi:glycosyltransferase involved in cell wall biosynthesis
MLGGQVSSKIRVAFSPLSNSNWMGGVNYYKNLFYALKKHAQNEIEIVIFLPKASDLSVVNNYLELVDECHYVNFVCRKKLAGFFSKVESHILGSSYLLETLIKPFGIDIISHTGFASSKNLKTIGWIPDFQHLHLPEMFSSKEIARRNKNYINLIQKTDTVFLSSFDALQDFKNFSHNNIHKAKVLQFVSQPDERYFLLNDQDKIVLVNKYNLPEIFFYLPNQFWKHKNHMLAFEAVKLLKEQGEKICLVCTGNLKDYRSPDYIKEIQSFISLNKLEENIRLLGIVPYNEVFALIKYSQAVINPSLFEGWSSTVEESKSVGKSLVISDICVHKEQAPNAIFFDKYSHESLAKVLACFTEQRVATKSDLEQRTKDFALTYISVVKRVLSDQ